MQRGLLLLCLLACSCWASAQLRVSGIVTDADQVPLIGATVSSADNRGTVTDAEGRYSLEVPASAKTLRVNYVGYAERRVDLNGRAVVDIVLDETASLEEVVVTALGLERANAELGYAVQQLDAREIADVPATNFLDNLSGQVAGVTVTSGPTGVGSTSLISIRGDASFGRNTPLFVVDGIPIDNQAQLNVTGEQAAGFQEVDFGSGMPEVSPFDVDNVSILKGPAAAALYGTRAANGVVLITTKGGADAAGTLGIEVNTQTTFERPFRLPQFQNTFGQGRSGSFAYVDGNGGGTNDDITFSYGPRLDAGLNLTQFDSPVRLADGTTVRAGDLSAYDASVTAPSATPFVAQPDNLADLYQTGVTSLNNVALSQSFATGAYRLSFTDLRSDSYLPGVNLERNNLAARLKFSPTDRLTISTGLTYVNTRSDNRPASGYGSENLNYSLVAWLGRSTNTESLRNYWQPRQEGRQQYTFNSRFFDNPYFILHENRNSFTRDRLFGFALVDYELTDKLSVRLRGGLDDANEDRQLRRAFSSNRWANGAYAENAVNFNERNVDVLLTYRDQVGQVDFSASVGANRLDQRVDVQQLQAEALSSPGIYRLSNAGVPLVSFGQLTERRINSAYGLLSAGWRKQVFADVTVRNEWSSALATPDGSGEVSFFYPSASLSWVVSRSLTLPAAVSFLQLRASAAQVGNDTDPYRTASAFAPSVPVGGAPAFTDELSINATGLRPEIATAFEAGVDVRFFDDRLGLDVTAYTQLNEDQIIALPLPISTGYESRVLNGGSVRATGLEAVLSFNNIKLGRALRYRGRLNVTAYNATVERLPEGVQQATIGYARVYDNPGQTVYYIAEEGGRIGDMYGTAWLRNEDGQYVVNSNGEFIADNTLRKLGNYNPDFTVGMQNGLSLGRLRLDVLLDWRQGGELVSRTQALAGYSGQLEETAFRPEEGILIPGVQNVGSSDAPVYVENTTRISPETYYIQYYNREHEEHNTLDATFVKLREVSLGYDFNTDNTSWLAGLSVAVVGRNLAAWSPDIKHFDPEQFAVQGQNFVRGVEDMSYPTPRSLGIRASAQF